MPLLQQLDRANHIQVYFSLLDPELQLVMPEVTLHQICSAGTSYCTVSAELVAVNLFSVILPFIVPWISFTHYVFCHKHAFILLCSRQLWLSQVTHQTVQLKSAQPVDSSARVKSPSRWFSQSQDGSAKVKSPGKQFSQSQVIQQKVQPESSQSVHCSARVKSAKRQLSLSQVNQETVQLG